MKLTRPRTPPLADHLPEECQAELRAIADWWLMHTVDHEQGGFYGEVDVDNRPVPDAPKSVVLNTRILWFFSEAARICGEPRYRAAATRAYEYLTEHFFDPVHGGVYWAVDARGQMCADTKRVYAQGFAIYALSAYYQMSRHQPALAQAQVLFELLEKHARDREHGGYLEAFSRQWGVQDDLRLSDKDLNYPKTMNTHLHILEAYTSLYQVQPEERIGEALTHCLDCFEQHIINADNAHLRMFMTLDWQDHSTDLSFGHDIEFSWLLLKALQALGNPGLSQRLTPLALAMADACREEALGEQGELLDTFELSSQRYHNDRVWWVQAEALVGFIYAYALSGDTDYLTTANNLWTFIKRYQIDKHSGEWFWFSTLDEEYRSHYKAGAWKCPYHNGRAMIEVVKVLGH